MATIGAADRRGGAPERLAAHRVADHLGDEVGREDEGDDQRLERLVRPVEEHPGEDAAAVDGGSRRMLRTPAARAARPRPRSRPRPRPGRAGSSGSPSAATHPVGRRRCRPASVTAPRKSAGRERLAVAEHRLVDVEEARVAADEGRAHLDALEGADPAAVAHRGAGDGQAPAVGAERAAEAGADRERHPAEVVEGQRAAVVELAPGVDVPGPAGVVRDVHAVERQRRRRGGRARARGRGGGKDTWRGLRLRRGPSVARISGRLQAAPLRQCRRRTR